MSHTVTVTRTTTTTTTTAILVNTGYLKTVPGILKLAQVLIGIVCVGIVGHYIGYYYGSTHAYNLFVPELYFLLISTTCLITTTCLLASCLLSIPTATILPKTLFEVVYHGVALILYITAGATLLSKISYYRYRDIYNAFLAAGILALVNAVLYLISLIYAFRAYRVG